MSLADEILKKAKGKHRWSVVQQSEIVDLQEDCFNHNVKHPRAPKTMKNKGFGHLKTRLFTIKNSKNLGIGGPWMIL